MTNELLQSSTTKNRIHRMGQLLYLADPNSRGSPRETRHARLESSNFGERTTSTRVQPTDPKLVGTS